MPFQYLRIANADDHSQGVPHGDAKRQVTSNGIQSQATPA